jgi:hypothetical protein
LLILGVVSCTAHGPENKTRDTVESRESKPRSLTVEAGHELAAGNEAFGHAVTATRSGRDVHVTYQGALPADGNYYFRVSGVSPDTLRVAIVDRNVTDERVSAVAPKTFSLVVPAVPSSVTQVAVVGPNTGYGTVTVPLR